MTECYVLKDSLQYSSMMGQNNNIHRFSTMSACYYPGLLGQGYLVMSLRCDPLHIYINLVFMIATSNEVRMAGLIIHNSYYLGSLLLLLAVLILSHRESLEGICNSKYSS